MIAARAFQVKPSVNTGIDYQFLALPAEVARRRDVSSAAKLLMAVVLDSARGNRSGSCKLSNASLAARIGCSVPTVKRLLAELEALGLVRRDTLAEKRVRTSIVPTWVDQKRSTEQASADQDRSRGGTEMIHPVGQERSTFQPRGVRADSDGPILSTLEGTGGADLDPKPGPAEIAKAMRDMVGGRYSSALFAQPEPTPEGPEVPPPPTPTPKPPAPPTPNPLPTPPSRTPRSFDFDPRRVGYSAVAAIVHGSPPRKTATQQLEELRRWSHGRST